MGRNGKAALGAAFFLIATILGIDRHELLNHCWQKTDTVERFMEFSEKIASLSRRSKSAEKQAETEEATKTAVVLPFLQALGFDVFDLNEVVPEFVADVGIKKGEKVDFAVKIDGKIAMLI